MRRGWNEKRPKKSKKTGFLAISFLLFPLWLLIFDPSRLPLN